MIEFAEVARPIEKYLSAESVVLSVKELAFVDALPCDLYSKPVGSLLVISLAVVCVNHEGVILISVIPSLNEEFVVVDELLRHDKGDVVKISFDLPSLKDVFAYFIWRL